MRLSVFQLQVVPLPWPRSPGAVRRFRYSSLPRAPSLPGREAPRNSWLPVGSGRSAQLRRRLLSREGSEFDSTGARNQIVFGSARYRRDARHGRRTARQGSGLVENDYIQIASRSSASLSLTRSPFCAPSDVEIAMTSGIARPRACGQAMTSTVAVLIRACFLSPENQRRDRFHHFSQWAVQPRRL
jgi:hypothetical protein